MQKIVATLTMIATTGAAILFFNASTPAFAYSIYPNNNPQPSTVGSTAATSSFDFGSAWSQLSAPFQGFFNNMQMISPSDTEIQIQTQIQSTLPSLPTQGENILTSVVNFLSWIINWLINISNQFAGWVVWAIKSFHVD